LSQSLQARREQVRKGRVSLEQQLERLTQAYCGAAAAPLSETAGHYAYCGITGNGPWLKQFQEAVKKVWQKWLNRRSRDATMPWERFQRLVHRYPLPPVRVVHSFYVAKP
jgi:hypothetical protein